MTFVIFVSKEINKNGIGVWWLLWPVLQQLHARLFQSYPYQKEKDERYR